MSAQAVASSEAVAPTAGSRPAGLIRVRERVIDKVVREASAVEAGVSRGDVDVDVAEWNGGLAVRVSARLPIPDLEDAEAIGRSVSIVDRVRSIQAALAARLAALTGRDITRVSFVVTGAIIPERKRVR